MLTLQIRSSDNWAAAFVASILFHALLIGGICLPGWNAQTELSSALIVELLAPASSIAAPAKRAQRPPVAKLSRRRQRPLDPLNDYRQDTVALNTERLKYRYYTGKIRRRIYNHWHYPEQARRARVQGELLVEFGILTSGELAAVKVLHSSGHSPLDEGAITAINAASPFPPLPPHFHLDRLNIRARFLYRLVAKR